MSGKLVIILAALLLFQVASADSIDEKFEKFKHSHSRTYTGQENEERKKIFQEHLEYIEDRQKAGIQVPFNDLIDKSPEELQELTGLVIDQQNIRKEEGPILKLTRYLGIVPRKFDYRTLKRVTKPKNQKKCKSSWGYTAVSYYESMLLMSHQGNHDLSEQYLLQNTYPTPSGIGGFCFGGSPDYAIDYIKSSGIPQDIEPSQDERKINIDDKTDFSNREFIKLKYEILQVSKGLPDSVESIKSHLVRDGPIIAGVKANFNGFYYPDFGGFVNTQECGSSPQVDHTVLIVGYIQHDGKEYWIVKNSWGTNWGEDGFGYVPIDMDCGISSHIYYVQHEGQKVSEQYQTIIVQLYETSKGAWHKNELGFKQDNRIIATFGSSSGSTRQRLTNRPQKIKIQKGKQTSIVVHKSQYASTRYIGFRVKRQDGSLIYQRFPRYYFRQQNVFHVFNSPPHKTYEAQLRDTRGNGWNGNTLVIKQGQNIIAELGKDFKRGTQYGPIYFNVSLGQIYEITTGSMGSYTHENSIIIRDEVGNIVFSFGPGKRYSQGKRFGYLSYGRALSKLRTTSDTEDQEQKNLVMQQNVQNQQKVYLQEQQQGQVQNSNSLSYNSAIVVAIVCLSALSIVLVGSLIYVILKLAKKDKKIIADNLGSDSNFKVSGNVV